MLPVDAKFAFPLKNWNFLIWAGVRKMRNVSTKAEATLKKGALVNETNKVALVNETPCTHTHSESVKGVR